MTSDSLWFNEQICLPPDETMVTVMDTQRDAMNVSHIDSDDEEDCPSSPGSPSFDHGGLMAAAMGHDVTAQLAAAGWQTLHGTLWFAFFCSSQYVHLLSLHTCFHFYFHLSQPHCFSYLNSHFTVPVPLFMLF